jgi:hypothetical protein
MSLPCHKSPSLSEKRDLKDCSVYRLSPPHLQRHSRDNSTTATIPSILLLGSKENQHEHQDAYRRRECPIPLPGAHAWRHPYSKSHHTRLFTIPANLYHTVSLDELTLYVDRLGCCRRGDGPQERRGLQALVSAEAVHGQGTDSKRLRVQILVVMRQALRPR